MMDSKPFDISQEDQSPQAGDPQPVDHSSSSPSDSTPEVCLGPSPEG